MSDGSGTVNGGESFNVLIIPRLEANGNGFSTTPVGGDSGAGKISKIIGKVEDTVAGVEVAVIGKVDEAVELVV